MSSLKIHSIGEGILDRGNALLVDLELQVWGKPSHKPAKAFAVWGLLAIFGECFTAESSDLRRKYLKGFIRKPGTSSDARLKFRDALMGDKDRGQSSFDLVVVSLDLIR